MVCKSGSIDLLPNQMIIWIKYEGKTQQEHHKSQWPQHGACKILLKKGTITRIEQPAISSGVLKESEYKYTPNQINKYIEFGTSLNIQLWSKKAS